MRIQLLITLLLISCFVLTGCRSKRCKQVASVQQATTTQAASAPVESSTYWMQWDECSSCDAAPEAVIRDSNTMQFFESGYDPYAQPLSEMTTRQLPADGQSQSIDFINSNARMLQSEGRNPGTRITLPPPTNFTPPINNQNLQPPVVPSTVIPDVSPASDVPPPPPADSSIEPVDTSFRQSLPFTKDNEFVAPPAPKVSSEAKESKSESLFDSMTLHEPKDDFAPAKLEIKTKLEPEPAKLVELPEKDEPQDNQLAARKPVGGVSGGASVATDAKFDTFKLSDLFTETTVNSTTKRVPSTKDLEWGPPVVVNDEAELFDEQQGEENSTPTDLQEIERQPEEPTIVSPPILKSQRSVISETVEQSVNRRTEAEIVRALQNSKVPNRVIYDNTPVIPQQEILSSQVVLNARPIEYYHEIRQIAETKKRQKLRAVTQERIVEQPLAQAQAQAQPTTKRYRIPVLKASTSMVRRPEDFDFRPLPELSALQQQVIKVGASGPAADEGFAPEAFPPAAVPAEPVISTELLPSVEPEVTTSLLPPLIETQTNSRVQTHQASSGSTQSNVSFSQSSENSVRNSSRTYSQPAIILRAAPRRDNWLDSTYDNGSAAKAKFRFVQPKFQRVIEQE